MKNNFDEALLAIAAAKAEILNGFKRAKGQAESLPTMTGETGISQIKDAKIFNEKAGQFASELSSLSSDAFAKKSIHLSQEQRVKFSNHLFPAGNGILDKMPENWFASEKMRVLNTNVTNYLLKACFADPDPILTKKIKFVFRESMGIPCWYEREKEKLFFFRPK